MKKRARRSFSPDFKLEAVRLVVEGRRPLSQVARELDLRPEQLRGWSSSSRPAETSPAPSRPLSLEERIVGSSASSRWLGWSATSQKSSGVLRERPARRFAMIAQHRDAYPLRLMCRVWP
ncbi:MAG: transposase [Gemmatimonadetes bacterium]|nr:transposase [Gemmatimonadota bacterium]